MPNEPFVYDTPEPIRAEIALPSGDLRVEAVATATTEVLVTPATRSESSARLAEQSIVRFDGGRLEVLVPRTNDLLSWLVPSGPRVDVRIRLPRASEVTMDGTYGDVRLLGSLGRTQVRTSQGDVHLEDADGVEIKTTNGDVRANLLTAHTAITTSNGDVTVRAIDGSAVLKTSNGDIRLDAVSGDVRATTANGDIRVEEFRGTLGATTTSGDVIVATARSGEIAASAKTGDLTFGVPEGTAVWVDVRSGTGDVRNKLETGEAPEEDADRLEIRGQTSFGDITLKRSDDRR